MMIDGNKLMHVDKLPMTWLWPPTRERWAYPDLLCALGKRDLLKSFYAWYALKVLDPRDKGQVPRSELIDYLRHTAGWSERTVKTHLAKGNNLLWEQPKRGRAGGLVCYLTASQVFRALDGEYRYFDARLMPPDCVAGGYDSWLLRQLESFVSHSQGKPFSRYKIARATGVCPSAQRRVGLSGDRNCLIRPVQDGDDLSDESLSDNLFLRWGDDELMQFLASSYAMLPVVPSDVDLEVWPVLDYFPGEAFYFWTEDEAEQATCRYDHYAISSDDCEIVPAGKGHTADAAVWYPGKDSDHWKPLRRGDTPSGNGAKKSNK